MAIDHTTEIRYSSYDPRLPSLGYFSFSGMPTPFLSRSQELRYYGEKWCQVTSLTLEGTVIGSDPSHDSNNTGVLNQWSIHHDRDTVLKAFSQDFKTLSVIENSTTYASFEECIIKSVSFSPANYGRADYSIEIECLEEDTFKGTFGVLDPVSNISFTEEENGLISVSHEVSARGFRTSGSHGNNPAIINAKNFVNQRTGYSTSLVVPQFLNNVSDQNIVLNDISTTSNRLEGTYGATLNYSIQTGSIGEAPLITGHTSVIDTNITSGIDSDFITVDVNYTLQGDKLSGVNSLRNSIPTSGVLYNIATGSFGDTELNAMPITFNVEDNAETSRTISIGASYDNDLLHPNLGSGVYFDYNVSVNTDDLTDVATVSIDGALKARGNASNKIKALSGVFFNDIVGSSSGITGYLFDKANEIYTGVNSNILYGDQAWHLNPSFVSFDANVNEIAPSIDLSVSFNNNDHKTGVVGGLDGSGVFKDVKYSVDVKPALKQYVAKASCNKNGIYAIYDLGTHTREKVTISANLAGYSGLANYEGQVHEYMNALRDGIGGGFGGASGFVGYVTGVDRVIENETIDIAPDPHHTANAKQTFSQENKGFFS